MLSISDYEMAPKDGLDEGTQVLLQMGPYKLSVITGPGAYGGGAGFYEIGIFNQEDEFIKLPGIHKGQEDDVIGYLSKEDVDLIILKLYYASGGATPVQVNAPVEA